MIWRLFLVAVIVAAISGLAMAYFAPWLGIRFNLTESLPIGFYVNANGPIKKGSIVVVCPPPTPLFVSAQRRGYIGVGKCPGGMQEIGKQVAGVPGDVVAESDAGVQIDGHHIAESLPFVRDPEGRALPAIRLQNYVLSSNEFWLMGEHQPLSFDSRYFGPVSRVNIMHVIRPLLTW